MGASRRPGLKSILVVSFSLLVIDVDTDSGNISGPSHKEKSAGKSSFSFKIDV